MEYMRLDGFLGRSLSRLLNKAIKKKTGYDPEIAIQNLLVETSIEDKTVNLTLKANMTTESFEKMIEEVTG